MSFYTEEQKKMQAKFDSRDLADKVEEVIVSDVVGDEHKHFIEAVDFFFLSTVNNEGAPTVSYKGGGVGFVKVIDSTTIVFPNYDGNGMFLSMGNINETAKIGMLFIDFETPNRIRVQATASVSNNDPMMKLYPGANLLVQVKVEKVFLNCARYIHKHNRIESSPYVPNKEGEAPYPAWKRLDIMQDSLRPEDKDKAEEKGTITMDDYIEKLSVGES